MSFGAVVIKVIISFEISGWLERILVFPLLFYRRLRYGYTFRRIKLTQNKFAIVDADDYERLSKYNWQVYIARDKKRCYAKRAIKARGKWTTKKMHRDIIDVKDDMVIDHINHNGLDNRKANLRPATTKQNSWNRRPIYKKGRFIGVSWHKYMKKWRATIRKDGKCIHIDYFDDEIEAAKAYDKQAQKLRGQFATLNFEK